VTIQPATENHQETQEPSVQISGDSKLWIRRFHPAPDSAIRLVCLPHAGGSASFFHPVSQTLSPKTEVLAVQYPGRQDRRGEPCVDRIPELADRLLDLIADGAGRPLALFGHSMGALLAFELAGLLEREAGIEPAVLFVSGHRAPSQTGSGEHAHLLDDEDLIAVVERLGGSDARVLGDAELRHLLLPAIRSDFKAAETYRPGRTRVLSSPINAMVGDADPMASVQDARAWKQHTTGEFDLRVFPGGHFYLGDRAPEVIQHIADRLDRATSSPTRE
jgi:surfactin synthase thioesterase subunit